MNHESQLQKFSDLMARFTTYFGIHLPDDVMQSLREMRAQQTSELAKITYDTMFRDMELANERNVPICQDTGVIQYFIDLGANFPFRNELQDVLTAATRYATKKAPLRHNAVQIFDEVNTGDNTGVRIPWFDIDLIPNSDSCTIYAYMAGGGCSLPGTAKVLMPVEGYEGVVKYVLDTMCDRGVNACPPYILGIGIAGSIDVAARLSKRALMRPVGSHNSNKRGAEFERLLTDGINKLGIGPGGLGGVGSIMGVHVEQAARHPSAIAVAISTGCWAHRRACIKVNADLSYEFLSHKGVEL